MIQLTSFNLNMYSSKNESKLFAEEKVYINVSDEIIQTKHFGIDFTAAIFLALVQSRLNDFRF